MLIIKLVFSLHIVMSLPCSDLMCSSCPSGLIYSSKLCLDYCPTLFGINMISCIPPISSQLFSLNFSNFYNFNAQTIENFSSPSGPFNSPLNSGPVPTIDRGFYFTHTSTLISQSPIYPAPDFVMILLVRCTVAGTLVKIQSDLNSLLSVSSNLTAISAVRTLGSASMQTFAKVGYSYSENWFYFAVKSSYDGQNLTLTIQTYTKSQSVKVADDIYEELNPYMIFGGGFEGFIYKAVAYNSNISPVFQSNWVLSLCDFNTFDENCQPCTYTTWPSCVRQSPNLCYSSSCSSCDSYNECLLCGNSFTPPFCDCWINCASCTGTFQCQSCMPGFVLIDGLCLNGYYRKENELDSNFLVIDTNFTIFQQIFADVFTSGSNSSTYSPFNNPEPDDPVYSKNRGVYFKALSYMKSSSLFVNYQNTIGFWLFQTSAGALFSKPSYTIFSDLGVFIKLRNPDIIVSRTTESPVSSNSNQWKHQYYIISFTSGTTSIDIIENNVKYAVYSLNSYAFFDDSPLSYIGASFLNVSNFTGFIYSFQLWQRAIVVNDDSTFPLTCPIYDPYCVWSCGLMYYINTYTNSYKACDTACINGCSTWGTCNICTSADCTSCTSFTDSCTRTNSSCLSGFQFNGQRCCSIQCLDCFGSEFYQCLNCQPGKFWLSGICYPSCPLGFLEDSVNLSCDLVNEKVLDLELVDIQDQAVDTVAGIVFSTGFSNDFFLTGSVYDPVPAVQRGYYFTGQSFMYSQAFLMPSNSTYLLFLYIVQPGLIFAKDKLMVSLNSGNILIIKSGTKTFACNAISVSQWISLSIQSFYNIDGTQYYKIVLSSFSVTYNSISLLQDTISSLYIGSQTGAFVGFFWRLQIFATINPVSPASITLCTPTISSACLWNCSIMNFFNNTCSPCKSNCINGCRNPYNCVLCEDLLCNSCKSFFNSCDSCVSNAVFNGNHCICSEGFFFNAYQCTACDVTCKNCSGISKKECISCLADATLNNGSCQCNPGYFWNGFKCEPCNIACSTCFGSSASECLICNSHYYVSDSISTCKICSSSCLTCFNYSYYSCLSCSTFLLDVVCVPSCPLGYHGSNGNCTRTILSAPIISYQFTGISFAYIDKASGIEAVSGKHNSIYPNLDITDPIPASNRGLYFTGNCSHFSFPSLPILLLGLTFHLSLWINPAAASVILHKSNTVSALFNLSLTNTLQLKFSNYLADQVYFTENAVKLNNWNHVVVSFWFEGATFVSISMNLVEGEKTMVSEKAFMDEIGGKMVFGADFGWEKFYIGFLYMFEIYIESPGLKALVNTDCKSCDFCIGSGCLPNCNITQYNTPENQCNSCLALCRNGCSNDLNCDLCKLPYCAHCINYYTTDCTLCIRNYQLVNGVCEKCKNGTFYDEKSKICRICPDLCGSCISSSQCLSCASNSSLGLQGLCICNEGYSGVSSCNRNYFSAFLSIDNNNLISLIFTEMLEKVLSDSDIEVIIDSIEQDFVIGQKDLFTYTVQINFTTDIEQGTNLILLIIPELISQNNSILSTKRLKVSLFASTYSDIITQINQMKSFSTTIMSSAVSTVLGTSLISIDPFSFFNFLNSIEMLTYVSLFNIQIDPLLLAFLSCLQLNSIIPSVFTIFINQDQGGETTTALDSFGYSSDLILLNSGLIFTTLISMIISLFLLLITKAICRQTKAIRIIQRLIDGYKYNYFWRLWLQSCLQIGFTSVIGFKYNRLSSLTECIDYSICVIFITIDCFMAICLLIVFGKYIRYEDEMDRLRIRREFSCFFQEFRQENSCSFYYVLFVCRRVLFVVMMHFIEYGVLQVLIAIVCSLTIAVYLSVVKPFDDKITQWYLIITEGLTFFFYLFFLVEIIKPGTFSQVDIRTICISITFLIICSNIINSVTHIIAAFFKWRAKRRSTKVSTGSEQTQIMAYDTDILYKYRKKSRI